MARGFLSTMRSLAREAERDARRRQRLAEKQQAQEHREAVRALKERVRAAEQAARATQADYVESRQAEVEVLNAELEEEYAAIDGLLAATLDIDDYFDLEHLRREHEDLPFEHGELEQPTRKPAPILDPREPIYEEPPPPKAFFGKKKKHEAAIATAQSAFELAHARWLSEVQNNVARREAAQDGYEQAERERLENLGRERLRHSQKCADRVKEVAEHNAGIDSLIVNLGYGAVDAVEAYISIVFSHSLYPDHFSVLHEFRFEPSTAELQLRASIPPPSEVEATKIYRYVKKTDEITSTELSQKARRDRYSGAAHQVALRSIHEVFEADRRGLIKTISLEVGSEATDPATGKLGFIPFVAVAAEREAFIEFDLSAVVPKITLEHLGAALSKDPYGLVSADTSGVRRA